MSKDREWMNKLVEKYQLPDGDSGRTILKESQLKNILNDEDSRKRKQQRKTN